MIDSIDPQLMKYVITALIAMVNEGATVEEQLDAACNVIILNLLDVFDTDPKCFKRIIKSLALLMQARYLFANHDGRQRCVACSCGFTFLLGVAASGAGR